MNINDICTLLEITQDKLRLKHKNPEIVINRYAVVKYLREYRKLSWKRIGMYVNQNYSTCIQSLYRMNTLLCSNDKLAVETWRKLKSIRL